MRLLFFNWAYESHGSAQDIHNYAAVARELGHEVALYGSGNGDAPFPYARDVEAADAVIFIFEYTTYVHRLDLARLVSRVPRRRRVVIDCDGKYNERIRLPGDSNHLDADAARRWREVCEGLSDKICQPTLRPLRPHVRTFLFHAYNPAWEAPLEFTAKPCGMCYVGNNWYRWRPLERLLRVLEPIRDEVKRIRLVGNGWLATPARRDPDVDDDAYYTNPNYLRELDVEVQPPVRFDQVVPSMSQGMFSPVLYRPLFDHLGLVSCRTFETLASGALPLFAAPAAQVAEFYGEEAAELALPAEDPQEKILDLLHRPEYYGALVRRIRQRLAEHHSYRARLQELIEIVKS